MSDGYSANTKAEHGLQEFMPGFVKNRVYCGIHRLATALKNALNLDKDDVSGVLSTGLGCAQVGSARTLRHCLAAIFENELEIQYSEPPTGKVSTHRYEVYDRFLPVDRASSKSIRRQNRLRRMILDTFLNGDITQDKLCHFCPYACCNNAQQTFHHFRCFVAWALVPCKCPVYCRKDWRQSDSAVDWVGVLAAHHNLLERVLNRFAGKPTPPPPPSAIQNAIADKSGWSDDELEHEGNDPTVGPLEAITAGDAEPEHEHGDGVETNATTDGPGGTAAGTGVGATDWASLNAKNKTDMVLWSRTRPYERLVVIREVLEIMQSLFAKFFLLSGSKWNKRQEAEAAKGIKRRRYRVVEAARGQDIHETFNALASALQRSAKALCDPIASRVRSLRFRMLVSCMCSLHYLLRLPRKACPFSLFLLLDGNIDAVKTVMHSACMQDDLTKAMLERFPTEESIQSLDAQAILETVAGIYETDIAGIEAKHSTTREFWKLRSRGWTPSLEAVSAKFCLRHSSVKTKKNKLPHGKINPSREERRLYEVVELGEHLSTICSRTRNRN